ncbi:MAG TPA: Gfo/Idh/MocA family oxidoreductase [Fimbriimonadaceae bacterium]|nr:Gfo/Idh/MocA family oxidoreductase [Fimbriimonadaceae bacterium]
MARKTSRRDFLKASAAAAVGVTLGLPAVSEARTRQDSKKDVPRFALIGVTGRGGAHVKSASDMGVIVAMADVDEDHLAKVMPDHPDAATFQDYRTMLDSMHKEFDAVVIAIPDHQHAVAAAMAMHYGKHVYCEKPLTRTVGEARALARIAKEQKVMTQMGNQGTASTNLRKVAKLIQLGAFGKVKEVHCWTNRAGGWWPQGVDRPLPTFDAPKGLDWDLWVGPAPFRFYAPGYHPFAWRGWWDFGCGALGDIGCHCMNLPFMALDLRDPIAISAKTSGHNRDSFPQWSIITYEFGRRNGRPPLNLYWYDGGKIPSQDLAPGVDLDVNGSLIVCEKATLYSPHEYGMETHIVGGGDLPRVDIDESPGHFQEFANAVVGGPTPVSNFPGYSGPLTETVVLGNLAVWADGPRLEWDAANMTVKGTDEYDRLLNPLYRGDWEL